MADIYRFQKRYQTVVLGIWKSSLAQEDKEGLEHFLRDMRARGLGFARLIKLGEVLTMLGERIEKPFGQANENDIKKLVHHYEAGEYSFWTRHDIKVILKQYFAWLYKGKYPSQVAWICTTIAKTP